VNRTDLLITTITTLALILTCLVRTLYIPTAPLDSVIIGYSDIFGLYYRMIIEAGTKMERVQNSSNIFEALANIPIPYRDYFMEYPPVPAWLIYIATLLSGITYVLPSRAPIAITVFFSLSAVAVSYLSIYLVMRRRPSRIVFIVPIVSIISILLISSAPITYFYTVAIATASLLAVAQVYLLELATKIGVNKYVALYAVLSPSLLYFAVYNFDVIMLTFMVLGLYHLLFRYNSKKKGLALLGTSIAVKLVSLSGVLAILVQRSQNIREFIKKGIYAGLIPAILFLINIIVSPDSLARMIYYHGGYICENCLWLPLTRSPTNYINNILFYLTFSVITFAGVALTRRIGDEISMLKLFTWIVTGTVIFNYVFPPQFVIEAIPLLTLVAPLQLIPLIAIADILNIAATIKCFEIITQCFEWGTPSQILFTARNVLLFSVFLALSIMLIKHQQLNISRSTS